MYVLDALGCCCLLDNSHIYTFNSAIALLDEDSTQTQTFYTVPAIAQTELD